LIRIKGDKTFFKLSPVLKKYINTFIKDKWLGYQKLFSSR
jgi:hypothetical protein